MTSLGQYVVESLITLSILGIFALILVLASRRLGRPSGPLQLVARLPLEHRRAVYLVQAGSRTWLLGASEAGLVSLGELEGPVEPLAASTPHPLARFSELLGKKQESQP